MLWVFSALPRAPLVHRFPLLLCVPLVIWGPQLRWVAVWRRQPLLRWVPRLRRISFGDPAALPLVTRRLQLLQQLPEELRMCGLLLGGLVREPPRWHQCCQLRPQRSKFILYTARPFSAA